MSGGSTISTSETRIEALQLQSSAYGVTVPVVYGTTRVSGNMIWYGDFKAIAHTTTQSSGGKGGGGVTQENTTYTYSASVMMGVCEGSITAIPRIWKDKQVLVDGATTALAQLSMSLATGAEGQSTWAYLSSFTPTGGTIGSQALGYSGLSYVYAQDYALGNNASCVNHSFEVRGKLYGGVAGSADANTALVASDVLTNARYGAAFPSAQLVTTDWSNYVLAAGLLTSPALTEQMPASEFVAKICALTNTAPVWTGGQLKMIPYGDTTLSANGATYSPSVTPLFDLTDDDFTPSEGNDPIKVVRKSQADAYNHFRIEFLNRANFYNPEISEAKDSASIDAFGLRSADVVKAHWICDATVARTVVQQLLQRSVYIRNTYEFNLPWTRAMLEPMDLVTLTDSGLGFTKLAVRVTDVAESELGDLTVVAEDFPVGVAHAALYTSQAGAGFQHNYSAAPGNVATPKFFEAPVTLTLTGLEVYAAVMGTSADWGGCRVWVSLDGTNYKDKGMIYGGARFGTITGAVSGGVLPVSIGNGQLISGSAADASNLSTLCYVGGAAPEYLAYTTATLTGALAYNLGGLNRNAYGSNPAASAHTNGDLFVRVDSAIAKSGPLDLSLIGKTIYLKFTSFNIYKSAEQSLADVVAYSYAITGSMALLAPAAVTGFTTVAEGFGIRASCNANPEPDVVRYEYRLGASWAGGSVLTAAGGTTYLWAVQVTGSYTLWVSAVDAFGNYGAPVSSTVVIAPATVTVPVMSINGAALAMAWSGTAGSFAISGYEVRQGASWAAGVVLGFRQVNNYQETIAWVGTRTYWVAAIDVKGNYGTAQSQTLTVSAPSVVVSLYANVVDNTVMIYWSPPAVGAGQLPITSYEVRRGATWAAGTVIGSNGNSTFAAVTEQQAAVYTYWIAAIDTAGTYGVAIGVVANVNQPPDYVLRADINSVFGGTKSNALAYNGGLLLPVNTTETWTQHFVNNGYATPQAQISAGNPLYIEPSLTTASYTELFDYGATLPATNITVTLNSTPVVGTVTASCQIQYSNTSSTGPWTSAPAGATSALASNFRWVQVVYSFTAAGGANLLQVNALNIKLSIKQRNDSGAGVSGAGLTTVSSVSAYWATVNFGYAFISADCPIIQANSTTALIPIIVYVGGVNPTGFQVAFVNTSGANVANVPFSWSTKGY